MFRFSRSETTAHQEDTFLFAYFSINEAYGIRKMDFFLENILNL